MKPQSISGDDLIAEEDLAREREMLKESRLQSRGILV
jgi:hypothetical protein